MNPLFVTISRIWPVVAAGAVGALVPRRSSRTERAGVAVAAALCVLFVMVMWPEVAKIASPTPAVSDAFPRLLSWTIGIPLVGAVVILFVPRQSTQLVRALTLAIMALELIATLALLKVEPRDAGYWLEEQSKWVAPFGIRYHVALDGISLWLLVLSAVLTPIAAYVSFGSIHTRLKDFCFALLLLEGAMVGSLLAVDLFLFYVMWELMLVPMYVLIGVWGGTNRIRAALKFFIYTMTASMFMLAAILYVVLKYRALSGGETSWDLTDLASVQLPLGTQRLCFFAFAVAFLVKVPMFPLHTWLPDAHTEAPTGASIILAAIMLKLGCYGYIRFGMGLFPHAAHQAGATLAGVAVVGGILYGALCALKQNDVKRLVAYSSVSHLGFVMLGIFSRNTASMEGAILQMVNHGISTGALFLLVGVIYDRRHTREVAEFGGLAKVMPWYAAAFMIVTFSSIGLPGTNGFVGEWLVISGAFMSRGALGQWGRWQALGAAIGVILSAAYMLTVAQKMFFGPVDNPKNRHLPDLTRREVISLAPLVVLVFVIGLFPRVFTEPMHGTIDSWLRDFNARVELPIVEQPTLAPRPASPPTAQSPAQ